MRNVDFELFTLYLRSSHVMVHGYR